MRGTLPFLIIVALTSAAGPARAQARMEQLKQNDTLVRVKADADMAAAMKHARTTLPQFLALARDPKPSTSAFALKVGLKDGNGHEFVWVRPFERQGKTYSGSFETIPDRTRSLSLATQ